MYVMFIHVLVTTEASAGELPPCKTTKGGWCLEYKNVYLEESIMTRFLGTCSSDLMKALATVAHCMVSP